MDLKHWNCYIKMRNKNFECYFKDILSLLLFFLFDLILIRDIRNDGMIKIK